MCCSRGNYTATNFLSLSANSPSSRVGERTSTNAFRSSPPGHRNHHGNVMSSGTAKILLLLCLLLPVTAESGTSSPSTSSEPEKIPEVVVPSTTNEPVYNQPTEAPEGTQPPKPDIGIGNQNISAVNEEVLNTTKGEDPTTVFTLLTTLLADTEPTTTDPQSTSTSQAVTRRSVTTSEKAVHDKAKDESSKQEHDEIFKYEYGTLRQWGLICALILCIIGFLVLFSGRCRGASCRRRQRRRYNITGL